MGDIGKQAPAPETHPKKEKPNSHCWTPSTRSLPRREKSPLSLGCTPARARDSEHGGLEAWVPELPGDPVSHAPRLALCAALV